MLTATDTAVVELVKAANRIHAAGHRAQYQTEPDVYTLTKEAPKYLYLDRLHAGEKWGSGCHLIERETGEVYGIKDYGKIHRGHPYGNVEDLARLMTLWADRLDASNGGGVPGYCPKAPWLYTLPSVADLRRMLGEE